MSGIFIHGLSIWQDEDGYWLRKGSESVAGPFTTYQDADDVRENSAETYRDFILTFDPPPIPDRRWDWHFAHVNYDGAPDSGDHRHGDAASLDDCKREIDALIDDETSL